jgi:cytochrome P450
MIKDPFAAAREEAGVLSCPFQGEAIPMLLRHADVRTAAKEWQNFSSDAPFRVPIPSEEEWRGMRQLPIETDPPQHGEYRAIVEPFFRRAKDPLVVAGIEAMIADLIDAALQSDSIEVVREFALPLQSRALALLLAVPEEEAETWISWGVHVFRDGADGAQKGQVLEEYLQRRLDQALREPGEDFFTALTRASYQGRALTREEMMGFANLTFAGGRDTVIHTISSIFAHFAEHPESLQFLREDPSRIIHAGEEFFRWISPLTHIGRVCPVATDVQGSMVPADGRVSLGWAAANFDPKVFANPLECKLDRKPNPHVAFGFGTHLCLGAAHARLLVRTLLECCITRVSRVDVLEITPHIEHEAAYERKVGYDALRVRLIPIKNN